MIKDKLNARDVGLMFLKMDIDSSLTCEFDKKYGQKKNRWWDDIDQRKPDDTFSKQRIHVANYFLCWHYGRFFKYGESSPSKCRHNCAECYRDFIGSKEKKNWELKSCEEIYNHIKAPEMMLWIYEALALVEYETLEDLCEKYKDKRCFEKADRVPWKDVEMTLKIMNELKSAPVISKMTWTLD